MSEVNLKTLMAREQAESRPVPIPAALTLIQQIGAEVQTLHARGGSLAADAFLCRDFSPDDVWVRYDGRVRIDAARFASWEARPAPQHLLRRVQPRYAAPEAIEGKPCDPRADQCGLGVMLWELIAGRRLFAAPSALDEMMAAREGIVPFLAMERAGVPQAVEAFVGRLLDRSPAQRFEHMLAVSQHAEWLVQKHFAQEGHSTNAWLKDRVGRAGSADLQSEP